MLLGILALILADPTVTEFVVSTDKDPITDHESYFIQAGNPESGAVILGCPDTTKHKVNAVIGFESPLGDASMVTLRVDAKKPILYLGDAIGNGFKLDRVATKVFIKDLRGGRLLAGQVTLRDGTKQSFTLAFPEPTTVIDPMIKACGVSADSLKPLGR